MTAAVPPPLPAGAALPLPPSDFSDRLSPIIVKELRQGLRTKVFVSLFITLQVLMTLGVAISLTAASQDIDATGGSSFFWFLIGLPVVFIMPFRGFGSVGTEIKANTLDLILLTRLSARRIIIGKWLAIVAQTTLFVFAVLPYAVLRYFIGGVNLVDDLIILGSMLFASAVLTALTVGISPYQNRLTRVLFWFGVIFLAQAAIPVLFMVGMGSGSVLSGTSAAGWSVPFAFISFGLLGLVLMLEVGASKIAPEAENHAFGKRLIGFLFLLIASLFTFLDVAASLPITLAAFVIGLFSLIGAVCEPVHLNAGLFRPFARRGAVGRIAGRFLYPGWPAGILFAVVYLIICGILLSLNDALDTTERFNLFLAGCGALFFPAALIRAFVPRNRSALLIFIGIQTFCIVAAIVTSILDNIFDSTTGAYIALIPTSGLLVAMFQQIDAIDPTLLFTVYVVILAASLVTLLARSRQPWRDIAALERRAVEPV